MTFSEDAVSWAKSHQKELIQQYCDPSIYLPSSNPMSFFMAGSPGVGKTEYSTKFISSWEEEHPDSRILRLDVDELRRLIPGYTGSNSDDVQRACTIIFEKIQDHVLHTGQSIFIDGTFSSPKSFENVKRHIQHNRSVGIMYLYQSPLIAWDYTKKRERLEGRTVPKDVFIRAYFESRRNVALVKQQFGNKVQLDLVVKNDDNSFNNTQFNVGQIDDYLKKEAYTPETLTLSLQDYLPNNDIML